MLKRFFQTPSLIGPFITRVGLGIVILPHGFQKLLGLFGGFGWSATIGFFSRALHVPIPVSVLVILGESLGSVAMILGFMTRFVAASYIMIMLGAIMLVHLPNGFFMNWFGKQAGEGYEYHILVITMSLALLFAGGGKWSVDGLIAERMGARR